MFGCLRRGLFVKDILKGSFLGTFCFFLYPIQLFFIIKPDPVSLQDPGGLVHFVHAQDDHGLVAGAEAGIEVVDVDRDFFEGTEDRVQSARMVRSFNRQNFGHFDRIALAL